MAKLTELTPSEHKDLKIAPNAPMEFAARQHVLSLSAVELAHAATSFPVFATRNNVNGNWAFSAMTSFELEQNLFVEEGSYKAVYQPTCLRTYPLFLMQSPKGENQFTIGFDEEGGAVTREQGASFFTEDGKATDHLSEVTKMLEGELNNMRLTHEFAQSIEKLNLFKALDLKIQYEDGTVNTIKGLNTIDEDVFKTLSGEQLASLNEQGYLTPIHGLLISIFQMNTLITKNNALANKANVVNVKMEVSKEFTHA